ncbi:hypothetical protein [Shewanella surugensis]|uniref:Rax2-like C-terminal domain-containing protein n=1 Tax=Shewanella surugensis TaxID=212020 RepID=A0ABT0LLK2_9GAMM|nr:hypothetical protein [Shewanella surugensis]MCL1128031.1 hypothetical protein [Shewanella surugensis]
MPHTKSSPTNQASSISYNWRLNHLAELAEYSVATHFRHGLLFCATWNPSTQTGYLESVSGPTQSGTKLNGIFFNDITQICSDNLGNIYIAGDQLNKSDQGKRGNYVIKKYNIASNELTILDKTFNGCINFVCCDRENNIYVTGNFTDSSNQKSVMKFDVTTSEWQTISDNNIDNPLDMCIDDKNRLYVLHSSYSRRDQTNTVSYLDGTSWSNITSSSLNQASAIGCDNNNNLFFNYATKVMAYNTITKAYTDLGTELPTYLNGFDAVYLQHLGGTLFVACCGFSSTYSVTSSIFAYSDTSWSEITPSEVKNGVVYGVSTTHEHPYIAVPSNLHGILIGNPTGHSINTDSFLK